MPRRQRFGTVDFSEGHNHDNEIVSYCKHCIKFGFQVRLKNRIYPDNQPIPVDHENYRQCYECGSIVPIYELEKESSIKDVVETSDNPFDQGKEFLGIDSRKARKKKQRDKQFEDINDENAKAELAKGNTLLSYSEFMPQSYNLTEV